MGFRTSKRRISMSSRAPEHIFLIGSQINLPYYYYLTVLDLWRKLIVNTRGKIHRNRSQPQAIRIDSIQMDKSNIFFFFLIFHILQGTWHKSQVTFYSFEDFKGANIKDRRFGVV